MRTNRRFSKLTDEQRERLVPASGCPIERLKPAARKYLAPIDARAVREGLQGCSCRG